MRSCFWRLLAFAMLAYFSACYPNHKLTPAQLHQERILQGLIDQANREFIVSETEARKIILSDTNLSILVNKRYGDTAVYNGIFVKDVPTGESPWWHMRILKVDKVAKTIESQLSVFIEANRGEINISGDGRLYLTVKQWKDATQ